MSEQERLLSIFCRGVHHPQVSGFEVLELLDVRSALARCEGDLTATQRQELEEADGVFIKHAEQFYENIVQIANLAELRRRSAVLPSHWWWYLEKLGSVDRAAL